MAFRTTTPTYRYTQSTRALQVALFGASILWAFAAGELGTSAARGISSRFNLQAEQNLLSSILFLFLLAVGFSLLQAISGQRASLRDVLGLPSRSTAREEWTVGVALGWGALVLAVLPIAVFGSLRINFWTSPRSFLLLFINLVTLLVAALAEEIAFRGYPFRRLIEATGPIRATVLLSCLFGLVHARNPEATWISILITMMAGVLFSVAWFRTHGLWLAWGLHFAWNASMGVLFGLPVSGLDSFSSVVDTRAVGPFWLTGGGYGPEAAFFTLFAIAAALIALVVVTRDYAWNYTHPPIIAGGYPLDVAPPPAHAAMEAQAESRPASLVQILPATPTSMSSPPPPAESRASSS